MPNDGPLRDDTVETPCPKTAAASRWLSRRRLLADTASGAIALRHVHAEAAQATPAASPVADVPCGTRPTGALLVDPTDPDATGASRLSVIDPATGDERRRFDLAAERAFATALTGRALVQAAESLRIIDIVSGAVTPVDVPAEIAGDLAPNPLQFRKTAGTRWLLVGTPQFDATYAIDLQTGRTIDLAAAVGTPEQPARFIADATVSADDRHIAVWDGRYVHLIETVGSLGAKTLDIGEATFAPAFSADGRSLIFSRTLTDGESEVLVQSLAGGDPHAVARGDAIIVTLVVPGKDALLLDRRSRADEAGGGLSLLDLATETERPFLSYRNGIVTAVQFDPGGAHALIGIQRRDEIAWHLADLATATTTPIPEAADAIAFPGLYADSRWAILASAPGAAEGSPGTNYLALDLTTGEVRTTLTQDDTGLYFPPQPSPNGAHAFVSAQTDGRSRLWLLDNASGGARLLAEGVATAGLFSPDGCWVAVAERTAEDGVSGFGLSVHPAAGGEAAEIGAGMTLVWITT